MSNIHTDHVVYRNRQQLAVLIGYLVGVADKEVELASPEVEDCINGLLDAAAESLGIEQELLSYGYETGFHSPAANSSPWDQLLSRFEYQADAVIDTIIAEVINDL